jgi:hypothetical protein
LGRGSAPGKAGAAADPQALRLAYGTQLVDVRAATAAEALAAIKAQAFLAEAVDASALTIIRSRISTGLPDTYKTRMTPKTLANYAAEAEAGVSVCYGHDHFQIIGRSFSGVLTTARSVQSVDSECFIPGGLNLAGVSTDEIIRAVSLGILRDVSVGFWGGRMMCSICGLSLWDADCPHIPGVTYPVPGKRAQVEAFADIDDAHLGEYSLVYDGSTPQTSVLAMKAIQQAEAGLLEPETARMLETQFRVRIGSAHHSWAGAPPGSPNEEEARMGAPDADADDDTERQVAPDAEQEEPMTMPKTPPTPATPPPDDAEAIVTGLRELLVTISGGPIVDVMSTVAELTTEIATLRAGAAELETLRAKVVTLEGEAADGRAYRADLLETALAEGVRAMGDEFDAEKWLATLQRMTPEQIRVMAANWTRLGDAKFPGGRQSEDPPTPAPTPIRRPYAAAYRA